MTASVRSIPDTNVIIRYLIRDVPAQYDEIAPYFEGVRAGREKALILEGALLECVYVLMKYYKVPKDETVQALAGLLQYKGILNPDRNELLDALSLFRQTDLDVVDCLVLARAKNGGMGVITFDKAMKRFAEAS